MYFLKICLIKGKNLGGVKMRYQVEYHPNPLCISIHVDKQLTAEGIEMFKGGSWEKDKQPLFVQDIFATVEGVTEISIKKYDLQLIKGVLFNWEEIIKKAVLILQMHLDPEKEMREAAAPMRYYVDSEGYRRDVPQTKGDLHTSKLFDEESEGEKDIG